MRSKKALKNVIFSLSQQIIAIICGFVVPRLIIKTYGSECNGLITSITQFLAYITLLEAGVGPVIKSQLYKPIAKKDKEEIQSILYASEKYFRFIAVVFLIYIGAMLVFYPMFVETSFTRLFSSVLIIIISISSFAEYFFGMTYKLFLHSDQKSYVVSIIQTITTVLNAVIIVVLALNNVSILIVKTLSSLVFVARPLLQAFYVRKHYSFDFSSVDKDYKLKNKWDGLAQHIAAIIYANTDVAILTIFSSVVYVSIYSVYNLVTSSLQKIIQSISDGIDASFGDIIAKKEQENLQIAFHRYEVIYYSLIAVIYSCTFSLIIPFVRVYTMEIKDANYNLPLFGVVIVLASFVYSIKMPYHSLVKTAGAFRQTNKGAWLEAILNLSISIFFVFNYGLIGVVIGTFVSTLVRTIELILYVSKNIVQTKIMESLKKIMLCVVEVAASSFAIHFLIKSILLHNLFEFILLASVVFTASAIFVLICNGIIYKDTFVEILKRCRKKIKG